MREGQSSAKGEVGGFLSVRKLAEIKKGALRHRVWYKTLSCLERGVIDLTIRYVDSIKSAKLAKIVTAIIEKLQLTMETFADKMVRNVGLPLARKISNIAVSWGNRSASKWAEDRSFARFLVLNFAKT